VSSGKQPDRDYSASYSDSHDPRHEFVARLRSLYLRVDA
jgi:hypothetical protein